MIGIFDSGIGGLTVVRAIEQALPEYPIIYFGDTARTPYGTKSATVIRDYSRQNTEFLLSKGAEIIVIGCNSASSVAADTLREEFQVPVYEVIGPAAAKAVSLSSTGKIGVIGTRATINSAIYEKTIRALCPTCRTISKACPLLVPLVEECWTTRQETKMIIRRYLHPLKQEQVDTLILGCTHYPLVKELIGKRMGRKVHLIDSSIEVAKTLKKDLSGSKPKQQCTNHHPLCYFSDITESVRYMTGTIFNHSVEIRPS